jgi:hypothetical protein
MDLNAQRKYRSERKILLINERPLNWYAVWENGNPVKTSKMKEPVLEFAARLIVKLRMGSCDEIRIVSLDGTITCLAKAL